MKDMYSQPTFNQYRTLAYLIEGWELVITEHCSAVQILMAKHAAERKRKPPSTERICWRKESSEIRPSPSGGPPPFIPYLDYIECDSPKRKRHHMSHMERYGWVIKNDYGWLITAAGTKAHQRFIDNF